MSRVKQMLELGAKHFAESSVDLFKMQDNEKVLMRMSAWDDVDEPPRFPMRRTPAGRKLLKDEDTLSPDERIQWVYAYPVFTSSQGWCVLVNTFGRNSLLSKIMTLLEAMGDYEAPFAVYRKGQGLQTEYFVYPANTSFKPEEIERFLRDYEEREKDKPTAREAIDMVKRIFSGEGQ